MNAIVRTLAPALAAAALLCMAGSARAQDPDLEPPEDTRSGSTELTLYGGGYFGGTVYAGTSGTIVRDVQVGDDWAYGARLGYVFNRTVGVELGYGRSTSGLTVDSGGGFQSSSLGELTENRYELNLNFYLSPREMRFFFTAGGGATHFSADLNDGQGNTASASDTRFTSNLGLGFQYDASEKVGLRIDGRWRYTDTNTGGSDITCDVYGFCYEYDNSSYSSAEIAAGLTYQLR
ncbi:MAG TPA: outer membrane beta-barrel protein [Candidatus Eisenbacteria bacterium]|nr:outer membrane beta-barrel protein [Candidatus Eisenbacteria bacterium]